MRISATTLESYRLWRDGDFMEESALLASIRGEFVRTPEMEKGSAFHSILERPEDHILVDGRYACDGHVFPGDVIKEALEHVDRSGIFEVKATKEYLIDGQAVTVVAKADQLLGLGIREHKTRWSTYEPDNYVCSFQWRFYLDIFEALSVTYVVFMLSAYQDGTVGLRGIEMLPLYSYPALGAECRELLADFVRYVRLRNLERYLLPRAA